MAGSERELRELPITKMFAAGKHCAHDTTMKIKELKTGHEPS